MLLSLLFPNKFILIFRISQLSNDTAKNSDLAPYDGMITEYWIENNVEGRGRGLIRGAIPPFSRRDWWKPRKTSFRIDRAENWTRYVPHTKLEC
jgi:hypothetical protein